MKVIVLFPEVPCIPLDLHVMDVDYKYVTLGWKQPKWDGGVPISTYVIEKSQSNDDNWIHVVDVSSCICPYTVHDLLEGQEYSFRVLAENSIGRGLPACLLSSVIPSKKPGAFFLLTITIMNVFIKT